MGTVSRNDCVLEDGVAGIGEELPSEQHQDHQPHDAVAGAAQQGQDDTRKLNGKHLDAVLYVLLIARTGVVVTELVYRKHPIPILLMRALQ